MPGGGLSQLSAPMMDEAWGREKAKDWTPAAEGGAGCPPGVCQRSLCRSQQGAWVRASTQQSV